MCLWMTDCSVQGRPASWRWREKLTLYFKFKGSLEAEFLFLFQPSTD